jgi:hypothetical protein
MEMSGHGGSRIGDGRRRKLDQATRLQIGAECQEEYDRRTLEALKSILRATFSSSELANLEKRMRQLHHSSSDNPISDYYRCVREIGLYRHDLFISAPPGLKKEIWLTAAKR